ncbi:MAG: T9SS type A sorting domain-containing protein [Ignavibacteriae bacterium]|nr:T9SS type A sorting domain-containing protein [Ignavibacteriota bacterium]
MKLFTHMLLLVVLVLSFTSIQSFAQKDTLVVYALPPGNLNNVINADTTAGGESAHVYVLMSDTTYFLTEEIRIKNLDIIGKTTSTGYIPVIAPFINADGSSPGNIAVAIDNGYVHFQNLYLIGTRTDGSQVTQQCISTSDSCRITLENCIIENFGSTGTPNILNTWNALGSDIIVDHCLFRNNQSDVPQNPGMNWAGPGVNAIDTMKVTNSTFFIMGGNIEGSGSSMAYLEFTHNTIFMHTKSSPFSMRQMHNVKINNNIFFSVYSAGLDYNHAYDPQVYNANFYSPPGVLTLDSLYSELESAPYNITEETRNIEAVNNAYFWPQKIVDNFATMNADPDTSVGHYRNVGGEILAPVWVAVRPGAEAILDLPNIKVAEADNFAMDPGFDAALVDAAADSMARFVRHVWINGGSGVGSRPFVYKASTINPFDGVPANWKTTQGYPVRENLRYTNTTLLTAANGNPLGDLTWFPEITVGVREISNAIPTKYSLDQNYPNPFNPTTNINYSITNSGFVNLKIFNILGQEVATLVNQEQKAGQYAVDFDGSKLASGIYMYALQSNGVTLTKKMMLLK